MSGFFLECAIDRAHADALAFSGSNVIRNFVRAALAKRLRGVPLKHDREVFSRSSRAPNDALLDGMLDDEHEVSRAIDDSAVRPGPDGERSARFNLHVAATRARRAVAIMTPEFNRAINCPEERPRPTNHANIISCLTTARYRYNEMRLSGGAIIGLTPDFQFAAPRAPSTSPTLVLSLLRWVISEEPQLAGFARPENSPIGSPPSENQRNSLGDFRFPFRRR
jgi:hypothetical protein